MPAHAQTRTTCDGVSFKVNLRRTVASYSQRLISAREAFLPSPLVVRPCLVRRFSSEYPPRPRPGFTPGRSSTRTPASSGSSHLTSKYSHTPPFVSPASPQRDGNRRQWRCFSSLLRLCRPVHAGPAGYHPRDDNQRRGDRDPHSYRGPPRAAGESPRAEYVDR